MIDTSVRFEKGVGPKISSLLSRLGIETVKDLIYYFPRTYEDRTSPKLLIDLVPGQDSIIKVRVVSIKASRTKRNFSIVKALVEDSSGSVPVIWFNQPFLVRIIKKGTKLLIAGRLERDPYSSQMVIIPRDYEVLTEASIVDPIVPRYSLTEGITNKMLRRMMRSALDKHLDELSDRLPADVLKKYKLGELKESIQNIHFPSEMGQIEKARHRLAFEELLMFQLGIIYSRKNIEKRSGISFKIKGDLIDRFSSSLPFQLTGAQKRVITEISEDMNDHCVMNRLIQGDVGCGKTIVALYSMIIALQNGYQAAIMAPTEILANQHFKKIKQLLEGLDVDVVMLTGSVKTDRKEILEKLKSGDPLIAVGSHALIEKGVDFGKLGLAVIDEQHRFGVEQRIELRKKGENIDILVMTATPIPRTLALTLYGDLDRSVIDEMPPGRTKITTRYIEEKDRGRLYEFVRKELAKGRQAYVVCPLVEISETLDLKAAQAEAKVLSDSYKEFRVGLVHGRMKPKEKDSVMSDFSAGKVNVLVSTTVIEVGIDVPNSTMMLVEHCERFGLSQLHQLRGRIGRGSERSYCFLIGELKSETARARIDTMLRTDDGFKIAEADLKLRGPGEFLGVRQWGLPNFKVADIINDEVLIKQAREAAQTLLEKGILLGINEGSLNRRLD